MRPFNLISLAAAVGTTTESQVGFLQTFGILKKSHQCEKCGTILTDLGKCKYCL